MKRIQIGIKRLHKSIFELYNGENLFTKVFVILYGFADPFFVDR